MTFVCSKSLILFRLLITRMGGAKKAALFENSRGQSKRFRAGSITIVSALFRPDLIGVKSRGTAAGKGSPSRTASAAEQAAEQRSAAGTNSDIDQITVTPIETWPPLLVIITARLIIGAVIALPVVSTVIVSSVISASFVIAVVIRITVIR